MSHLTIQVTRHGDPDVLESHEVSIPAPAAHEVQIRQTAIGLNFIDVYHRTGLYPVASLPFTPGLEAAGIVEEVGNDVTDLKPGDRIAYASLPLGAYTERRNFPANRCIRLPQNLTDELAAATLLKGMTAEYLLNRSYRVKPGDIVLIHAVAGGVGILLSQWAKALGATVIGTCRGQHKALIAKQHGCDFVIDYSTENFCERVMNITQDKGVDIVYDSVGRDTIAGSLACLKTRGMLVSFGQSSGPCGTLDFADIGKKSLFVTRPSLMAYTDSDEDLRLSAAAWFAALAKGYVKTPSPNRYALREVVRAHADLETRKTTGPCVLIP